MKDPSGQKRDRAFVDSVAVILDQEQSRKDPLRFTARLKPAAYSE